jgi:hypothetical protein
MEYPELTKEQQKRFRYFMVKCRFVGSEAEARKMTPHKKAFKEVFLKMMEHINASYGSREVEILNEQIKDICQLYAVDELPVVIDLGKFNSSVGLDRVDEVKSQRSGRGKGKNPVKRVTSVALEPDLYSDLERISSIEERSVGSVIRLAIKFYLDSKRIDEKPESVDDG